MIYGTAVFRYRRDFGWMPIDWMPYKPNEVGAKQVLVIRDVNGKPALLSLTGLYNQAPRLGQFCKRPHRLAVLLAKIRDSKAPGRDLIDQVDKPAGKQFKHKKFQKRPHVEQSLSGLGIATSVLSRTDQHPPALFPKYACPLVQLSHPAEEISA